jgi:hypothetical protein
MPGRDGRRAEMTMYQFEWKGRQVFINLRLLAMIVVSESDIKAPGGGYFWDVVCTINTENFIFSFADAELAHSLATCLVEAHSKLYK